MNSKNPKVTVLMPVYNGERYLHEAIESVLMQTFTDFEFLIIDDASTDRSVEIIKSYNDPRIRLVHNEKNLKLISTLNKGIDLADGKYIARMDCDDISLPQRLAKQVAFLEVHSSCAVVATKIVQIDTNGGTIGFWKGDRKATTSTEICNRLPLICCVSHPSAMIRKSIISKYRYNPRQRYAEDYDLWLRLCSDGHEIAKIDEFLLKYRVHQEQVTNLNSQVGYGLTNIKVKTRFLWSKAIKLRLNRFDLKVFKGLLFDLAIFIPKLVIKFTYRNVLRRC